MACSTDDAIGEIVNRRASAGSRATTPTEANAERIRDGWYWTGDLAYRDEAGFFYFAGGAATGCGSTPRTSPPGRSNGCWSASRGVAAVAVYAVPTRVGGPGDGGVRDAARTASSTPTDFAAFLGSQPDLGTKWSPRSSGSRGLPQTASGKVTKDPCGRRAVAGGGAVFRRAGAGMAFVPMGDPDVKALRAELRRQRPRGPWSMADGDRPAG